MPAKTRPTDPLPTVWDPDSRVGDMLKGKRGLVVGIANADSIAYGCAAKLRLTELNHVLSKLPGTGTTARHDILVDHEFSDDAAVVHHAAGRGLVLTADVIAPLVDDPAAAHG